ncbi:MAG: ATP-binding cassette domain-containing protein [Planctomycetota bacterium]|nr:MAG: ATP-binding cassette domain-containing protein [Planctomycetota bacterium]
MGNFARVVRLALRYYWTVAASFLCAMLVAVLWGGNIGFLYPLVEVVGNDESLSEWADKSIASAKETIAEQKALEKRLTRELKAAPPAEKRSVERELRAAVNRRDAAEADLRLTSWLEPWIDNYLPPSPFGTLVVLIVALLVATVIKDGFMALSSILADRVSQLAVFDLRKQFYRRTLRMDLATFSESGTSDLISRFTYDLENLAGGLQTLFGRATREPLKMIACLILAAYICWQLLVLTLVVAPLAGLLIGFLAKTLKRANRKALEEMSSLYGILVETFSGIKVVKAFTMERFERRRFHTTSKKFYKKAMRIAVVDALVNPVTEVMGITMICLAILAGTYLVMSGETTLLGIRMCARPLSLSALLAFYGALAGASDPARRLAEVFNKLQRASAAADRVYQLLDREPRVFDPARPQPLGRHHRELAFENVAFHYHPGQPVLEGIDLRVPFGETIAIVGPNGCGKSTLCSMIPRFFDPRSGQVLLDGVDLRDVRIRDLRAQIGIVTQETLLFDDTVLNNIRYGCPQASREQVIEAAQQAHAHRFIEQKLDAGYETIVGQSGGRLSGGQRQRIALARAILRDPAILILDEATSQIDLESEQLIHKVLEQFIRHRTTFIITHRLATLSLADRILVMNGGRIADAGTHEQLLARCELYQRLHHGQFKETA